MSQQFRSFQPEVFFLANGASVTVGIEREYVQTSDSSRKTGPFVVMVNGEYNLAVFPWSMANDICRAIMRAADACREFNEQSCQPPIPAPTAAHVSAEEF